MMGNEWGAPTDWETVCRRNAGRRHYNAVRSVRRLARRQKVARLLLKYGREAGLGSSRGIYARVARELGVHPGTICRDCRAIRDAALADLREQAAADRAASGIPGGPVFPPSAACVDPERA